MGYATFAKWRKVIMTAVFAGVAAAIIYQASILAVLSVGSGMVLMSFLKAQVTDMVNDERLNDIHEKAAMTSFRILLPILGLTAVALFHGAGGPFYFLYVLGVILGYITCLGLVIYLISFWYLNRKYGG